MLTFFCKGETMAKRKDTRTKIPILRQHIRGNLGRRELLDDIERWFSDRRTTQLTNDNTNIGKFVLT